MSHAVNIFNLIHLVAAEMWPFAASCAFCHFTALTLLIGICEERRYS